MVDERLLPTTCEINLGAIAHNVREVKKQISKKTKIMAVVKADAYGHGAVAVSKTVLAQGVAYLCVASLKEAAELREAGIAAPILILSESLPEFADQIVAMDLTQTVYSLSLGKALSNAAILRNKEAKVHVKVDTGMGRVGMGAAEAPDFIEAVSKSPNLCVEGIFTHLAKADEAATSFTVKQLKKFDLVLAELAKRGIDIPIKHAANSAASLFHEASHFDMIRVGIALYGLHSLERKKSRINLKPALAFKTKVMYLKKVPRGTPLSYGGTHITSTETQIATLPVGYADGFSRSFSNRGQVLIRGKRFPVVGRVCMDFTLIDVANAKVAVGDEVVLIGRQGREEISVYDIAAALGTVSYEVVCSIGKRVPRIYIN